MSRIILVAVLCLAGCRPGFNRRDGVTDGDAFALAPRAMAADDPAARSRGRKSLFRSTEIDSQDHCPGTASARQGLLSASETLVVATLCVTAALPG